MRLDRERSDSEDEGPPTRVGCRHEKLPGEPLDVPGVPRPKACPAPAEGTGACSGAASLTLGPGCLKS